MAMYLHTSTYTLQTYWEVFCKNIYLNIYMYIRISPYGCIYMNVCRYAFAHKLAVLNYLPINSSFPLSNYSHVYKVVIAVVVFVTFLLFNFDINLFKILTLN